MKLEMTIDAIRTAIAERRTTALAIAEEYFSHIKQQDSEIGAFLTLSEDRAMAQVERIHKLAVAGDHLPPLAGVPIAIKDVLVTRGVRKPV